MLFPPPICGFICSTPGMPHSRIRSSLSGSSLGTPSGFERFPSFASLSHSTHASTWSGESCDAPIAFGVAQQLRPRVLTMSSALLLSGLGAHSFWTPPHCGPLPELQRLFTVPGPRHRELSQHLSCFSQSSETGCACSRLLCSHARSLIARASAHPTSSAIDTPFHSCAHCVECVACPFRGTLSFRCSCDLGELAHERFCSRAYRCRIGSVGQWSP